MLVFDRLDHSAHNIQLVSKGKTSLISSHLGLVIVCTQECVEEDGESLHDCWLVVIRKWSFWALMEAVMNCERKLGGLIRAG